MFVYKNSIREKRPKKKKKTSQLCATSTGGKEIRENSFRSENENCFYFPTEALDILSPLDEFRTESIRDYPDVMTMNKRKLIMESNKHMLNYIEIVPGENPVHHPLNSIFLIGFLHLNRLFVGQLVFVTFKRDLKPISNKHRTYIRVDNFLHYEGECSPSFTPYRE